MRFEKLIVRKPDSKGILDLIRSYKKGIVRTKDGLTYVYWDSNKIDVYSGTFIFEITTPEVNGEVKW